MCKVVIIDNKRVPRKNISKEDFKIYWQEYTIYKNNKHISILNIIENNSNNIKSIYLDWIERVGSLNIKNIPVYESLKIRKLYSGWWQTYFVEKSNYEHSPQIVDAIKLIAFQEWAKEINIKNLEIYSNNKKLILCLRDFSKSTGLNFKSNGVKIRKNFLSPKLSIYKFIFLKTKALFWLIRRIKYSFPLINFGIKEFKKYNSQVIFVDYLINLNKAAVSKDYFYSNYWNSLTDLLKKNSIKSSWIHLPVNLGKNDNIFKNTFAVASKLKNFNKNSSGFQNHICIDSFLNLKVLFRTINDWLTLTKKGLRINLPFNIPKIEHLNLWSLYKDEWYESIIGVSAISNCLVFNLFDEAFKGNTNNSKLIYLCENQPWEFAMIQAWRKNKNEEIIAYLHSNISFWDLRKFFDPKTFDNRYFPMPDNYGINGKLSDLNFRFNKLNQSKIINLEATRYLYLDEISHHRENNKFKSGENLKKKKTILIVLDYEKKRIKKQLDILKGISTYLKENFTLLIKPHPGNNNIPNSYDQLKYSVTDKPLSELINEIELVFTSNTTTAALEFSFLGIPVISMIDQDNLNLSPLRNSEDIKFISNPSEMEKALEIENNSKIINIKKRDYFYLDKKLENWLNLIQK